MLINVHRRGAVGAQRAAMGMASSTLLSFVSSLLSQHVHNISLACSPRGNREGK